MKAASTTRTSLPVTGFRSLRRAAFAMFPAALLLALAGCSGTANVGISVTPTGTQVLDAGQSLLMQATVTGDPNNRGITWVVNGVGQLSGASLVPVAAGSSTITAKNTYYAPSTVTATSTVTVVAGAVADPTKTATVTITINPALTLTSTAGALPGGTVGTAYSSPTLVVTGGSGTIVYAVSSGTLPAGLTLNASNGVVSGTPTTPVNASFTVTATDAAGVVVSQAFTLAVVSNISITSASALPAGFINTAYSQQIVTTGGSGSGYLYALTAGTLPTGITLSTSGLLSGSPTQSGTYNFTIKVTDSAGNTTSKAFALSISTTTLTVTPATLPPANTGIAYSQQLTYTGGPGGTPTFSVASGALPAGLTLSSTGLLSGSATTPGTYTFSVIVRVGTATSAAQSFTIIVSNISINSGGAASGEVALPFSFPEQVSGGTAPYTWTLATGSAALPAGLTLNASTGLISGTPTAAGTSTVVIRVTDSLGTSTTQSVVITIFAARTSADNSQFLGQYAFLLTGFDALGNPLTWVGKMTVDGAGNVVSGTVDINSTALAAPQASQALLPATYAVGADNRGRLAITTAAGTSTFVFALNKPVNGVAPIGFLTEADSSGQSLTGRIALEDPTAFTPLPLTGGYAFGLTGFQGTATVHAGSIGQMALSGAGAVSSGELIASIFGAVPVPYTSGTYTVAATGRGTLTLVLTNGITQQFVFYVVSAKQLFVASAGAASGTSATALLAGQAVMQTTGGFTAASLSGKSVSRTTRLTPVVGTATTTYVDDVRVGILTADGVSAAGFAGDENIGGALSRPSLSGKYTVAANGRATAYLAGGFGGCVDCSAGATFIYLSAPNQGFALDLMNGVGTGSIEPQTVSSTTVATLSGTYVSGTIAPVLRTSPYSSAALSSNGAGALTETEDLNTNGTLTPDRALTATYVAASNGRVAVTSSDATLPVLYMVSPTRALAVDLASKVPVVIEVNQ